MGRFELSFGIGSLIGVHGKLNNESNQTKKNHILLCLFKLLPSSKTLYRHYVTISNIKMCEPSSHYFQNILNILDYIGLHEVLHNWI